MPSYAIDDAAAAALWSIRNAPVEHLGVIHDSPTGPAALPPQSRGNAGRSEGTFKLPGRLLALYHNHPPKPGQKDVQRAVFSPEDREQTAKFDVPSYISAGNEVFRYIPGSGIRGEPVLAQFPLEEIRRLYLSEALKK